jgi:hypothetical protein
MPCYYNSNAIIPAPLVSIKKEHQTTDDEQIIGGVYAIQVKGKLVAYKGSPNSTGTFWTSTGYPPDETLTDAQKLAALLRKQDALRRLFSVEGQTFEIQPWDGSSSTKCNPRIRSIEFSDGPWYQDTDYLITLEADVIYVNGTPVEVNQFGTNHVAKATEEWNIEVVDEAKHTYRLTHSLSAQGKRFYDNTGALTQAAWQNARDYVLNTITLGLKPDRMIASGVIGDPGLQAYNYLRTQHVNELGGGFAASETWLCYDTNGGPAVIEDWNASIRTTTNDGRINVSVEGTITGLEKRDNNSFVLQQTRWQSASGAWQGTIASSVFGRAEAISSVTLNPVPLSKTAGFNEVNGVITYHQEFDNRPLSLYAGSITEKITINNHGQADLFTKIMVPGRELGPVLQDLQAKTEKKRTVSLSMLMIPASVTYTPLKPVTDTLMLTFAPFTTGRLFVEDDQESWTAYDGQYSRTVSYVWE